MPKHLTHTTGHSAPAEFWGDPQDAAQIAPPSTPFVPLSRKKRPAPLPTIGALANLRDVVESWHRQLGSSAVAKAEADLHEAVALAETAKAHLTSIAAEQHAEDTRIAAAAREDAASGERRPSAERTDWDAERVFREEAWSLRFDEAAKASRRYRAVVASEAPKSIPALIERASVARAKAAPALRKAQTAVAEALAASDAITRANDALALQPPGWHRWPQAEREASGDGTIAGLLQWINAADNSELLSGRWVLDTSPDVPEHTLRALAEGSEFESQYVLPNILHAQGRGDEIRDETFSPDPEFRELHLASRSLPR